jgi:glyoxylase-like metal-dependent hydrolase (beta-lactamase superfamily II)
MRRVSRNAYTEIYFWGCNPGFVVTDDGVVMIDTPQQPIDAVRWRERMLEHGPIRHLVNTEPHSDHVRGNAYYPGVEVIGQVELRSRYEQQVPAMTSTDLVEAMKVSDPDSVWLLGHPSYPPNPPTRTFTDELTLRVGGHTFRCLHLPGHTSPQTAVHVPEEGVVFTGDNVFCRSKTFIQEADPWDWLAALRRIEALDADVIVPGHGEPCDRGYLAEQAEILERWVDAVQRMVDRGLTEEEAVREPLDAAALDPYPLGQRLFSVFPHLDELNVRNLYARIVARASRSSTERPRGEPA